MNLWKHYVIPASVAEALEALRTAPGPVLPIAGGTDLLLDLQQGRRSPTETLVDLNSVSELKRVELQPDHVYIGAAVPLASIVQDALVIEHAGALIEACELIGGPQVRNVATLGGNVAHALPAADGTIALLALDAAVEIADVSQRRVVPLGELFGGPGRSTLVTGQELIVGFRIPRRSVGQASAFRRIMRPQGVALPIINMAIWLERQDRLVKACRIAVGPGGPVPWRARGAENALRGREYSETACSAALAALLAEVAFRTSARRATSEYRRQLVEPLFLETLGAVWQRAEA